MGQIVLLLTLLSFLTLVLVGVILAIYMLEREARRGTMPPLQTMELEWCSVLHPDGGVAVCHAV